MGRESLTLQITDQLHLVIMLQSYSNLASYLNILFASSGDDPANWKANICRPGSLVIA